MPNYHKSTNGNWNMLSKESKEWYATVYANILKEIGNITKANDGSGLNPETQKRYNRLIERKMEFDRLFGKSNIEPDNMDEENDRLNRLRELKNKMIDDIKKRITASVHARAAANRAARGGKTIYGGPGSCIHDYAMSEFDYISVDRAFPELITESEWYREGIYKDNVFAPDLAKLLYGEGSVEKPKTWKPEPIKYYGNYVPNDVYKFSVQVAIELPKVTVAVEPGAFDKSEDKVQAAYFDKSRIDDLKLQLIKAVLESDEPFSIYCVDTDGDYKFKDNELFRGHGNKEL